VQGSAERPRLVVFRSNRGIEAQLVDDLSGRTVAAASWLALEKSFNQLVLKKTAAGAPLLAPAPEVTVASLPVIAAKVPFEADDHARSLIGFTPELPPEYVQFVGF